MPLPEWEEMIECAEKQCFPQPSCPLPLAVLSTGLPHLAHLSLALSKERSASGPSHPSDC